MLSDAELREMERLVGVRSGLPKQQARKLIDAYREATERVAQYKLTIEDMATTHYFQNETILPDGEIGLPVTTEEAMQGFRQLAEEMKTPKRQDRRKKNETLDKETEG